MTTSQPSLRAPGLAKGNRERVGGGREAQWGANPYDPLPSSLANVRTLNYQQCDDAFPLLWPEVHNTARMFQQRAVPPRNGITIEDLNEVEPGDGTRVSVVNGQLYVKRFNGEWTKRSEAVLASLHEAIVTSPDPFPDVEFWFRATDNIGYGAHFGLTKEAGSPLFGFFSWPEPRVLGWRDARRKAMEVDSTMNFTDKDPKLFWRGVFSLGTLRNQLREAVEGKEWNDVGEINWGTGAGRIPMEEHCRRQFLASADSHSYSGRLKYLLLCRSVVVTHRKRWKQHFHGALDGREGSPTQNWVEMEHENWDGLSESLERLLQDSEWAERIAENAQRTMRDRYLTPASVACYWRRILAEYAALQRFTPTPGGIDYESFILVREIEYPPH
ncbi:hypothetical protein JCM1841_002492 [Sporobolomyces salmonicolor]